MYLVPRANERTTRVQLRVKLLSWGPDLMLLIYDLIEGIRVLNTDFNKRNYKLI